MKILVGSLVLVICTAHLVQGNRLFSFDSPEDLFDDSRESNFFRTSIGGHKDSFESHETIARSSSPRSRTNFQFPETFIGNRRFRDSIESEEISRRNTLTNRNFGRTRFRDSIESEEISRRNPITNRNFGRTRFRDSIESQENHRRGFGRVSSNFNSLGSPFFSDSDESDEIRLTARKPFRNFNPPRTNRRNFNRVSRVSKESLELFSPFKRNFLQRSNQNSNSFSNVLRDSKESIELGFRNIVHSNTLGSSFRRNQHRFQDSVESREQVRTIPQSRRRFNAPKHNNFQSSNRFIGSDSLENSFEISSRHPSSFNRFVPPQPKRKNPTQAFGIRPSTVSRGFRDSSEEHFNLRSNNFFGQGGARQNVRFNDNIRKTIRPQKSRNQVSTNGLINHFTAAQHPSPHTATSFPKRFGSTSSRRNFSPSTSLNADARSTRIGTTRNFAGQFTPRNFLTQSKKHGRTSLANPFSTGNNFQTSSNASKRLPTQTPVHTSPKKPTTIGRALPDPSRGGFQFSTTVGSRKASAKTVPQQPSGRFSFNKRIGNSKPTTSTIRSNPNRIRGNTFSTHKTPGVTGFKWPDNQVSGFYVSMSTNNQSPTSYFVQIDD